MPTGKGTSYSFLHKQKKAALRLLLEPSGLPSQQLLESLRGNRDPPACYCRNPGSVSALDSHKKEGPKRTRGEKCTLELVNDLEVNSVSPFLLQERKVETGGKNPSSPSLGRRQAFLWNFPLLVSGHKIRGRKNHGYPNTQSFPERLSKIKYLIYRILLLFQFNCMHRRC